MRDWLIAGSLPEMNEPGEAADFTAAAREQDLAGVLDTALAVGRHPFPDHLKETLRNAHRAALARSGRLLERAGRVLAQLEAEGLRALPLKGAAVAETLYDSVGERPMGDVDILTLDSFLASTHVLERMGFTPVEKTDHAWAFVDSGSEDRLDLHRSLTSCPGFFPIAADDLWDHRRSGPGPIAVLPSPEDLLVQLSVHLAFQHGLVLPLSRHLDLRRLLERTPPRIERVIDVASRYRARGALAAALEVVQATVGAPVPTSLFEEVRADCPPALRRQIAVVSPFAFLPPASPSVGRVRWRLSRRRHFELLWRTLSPEPFVKTSWWRRAFALARRAVALLGKCTAFGPSDLRDHARGATFKEVVLRDCIATFPEVHLVVSGDCMSPALAPGEGVRLIGTQGRHPRFGDVVLVRIGAEVKLHRLVWRPAPAFGRWRTKGDAAPRWDPPVDPEDVLATAVAREGRPGELRDQTRALRSLMDAIGAAVRNRFRGIR